MPLILYYREGSLCELRRAPSGISEDALKQRLARGAIYSGIEWPRRIETT
jgi:hypothetical protein